MDVSYDGLELESVDEFEPEAVARMFEQFLTASRAPYNLSRSEECAEHPVVEDVEDDDACVHCKMKASVHLEDGNYVCTHCNTVVQRFLDHSAEWRYYGHDDTKTADPARCGPPVNELMPSMGSILTATGQFRGSIGSKMIRKYQMWNAMTYRERSLYSVCDVLAVSATRNGIQPVILEEAKSMYKRISELKISRGENRQAIIASCIYMACKTNGVPRSIKEIAEMFNVRVHCMTKACKTFQDLLNVSVVSSTPIDFVNRFCCKLNATETFSMTCRAVITKACAMELLAEYTPPSAVAGCIMLCSDAMSAGISKKRIAAVCQISVVTISKCYKHIRPFADVLLDGK
ncbi:putative transcription initiation factor IIB-like protein [Tetrabaena socialis]|uniref:Putative transcription initiation factor IIB-like protein n=1 Tax=Tetrabaena socialis TaxID=47790 RepID=A0A2J7ZNG9_9CHLO|nr:putative transcription initiation factor IIB-like protein [Tetrabaena socialis]|eukprot:PNH01821.1 putative transcription initiation factor IIB-like protein [Tetrabaena socialis]